MFYINFWQEHKDTTYENQKNIKRSNSVKRSSLRNLKKFDVTTSAVKCITNNYQDFW